MVQFIFEETNSIKSNSCELSTNPNFLEKAFVPRNIQKIDENVNDEVLWKLQKRFSSFEEAHNARKHTLFPAWASCIDELLFTVVGCLETFPSIIGQLALEKWGIKSEKFLDDQRSIMEVKSRFQLFTVPKKSITWAHRFERDQIGLQLCKQIYGQTAFIFWATIKHLWQFVFVVELIFLCSLWWIWKMISFSCVLTQKQILQSFIFDESFVLP